MLSLMHINRAWSDYCIILNAVLWGTYKTYIMSAAIPGDNVVYRGMASQINYEIMGSSEQDYVHYEIGTHQNLEPSNI